MGGFWNKCARAYKRADQPKDPETLELVFLFVIAIVLSYVLFCFITIIMDGLDIYPK